MRWSLFLTLVPCLILCGETLAAPILEHGEPDVIAVVNIDKRQDSATTTTATDENVSQTTATAATDILATAATATTTSETTTANTNQPSYAATSVPSLNETGTLGSQTSPNETTSTFSGSLPIEPELTPASGVGGFILLVLGGALAFIGIRKQW